MFFNFKNKNMIIILLLLILLSSVFCYSLMMKSVEGNENLATSYFTDNFKIIKKDFTSDIEYYVLDSKSISKEVSFEPETSFSALTPDFKSNQDVGNDIYNYMYNHQYDMYREATKTETPPVTDITPQPKPIITNGYEFYKITVPFSINYNTKVTDNTVVSDTTIPAKGSTVIASGTATGAEGAEVAEVEEVAGAAEVAEGAGAEVEGAPGAAANAEAVTAVAAAAAAAEEEEEGTTNNSDSIEDAVISPGQQADDALTRLAGKIAIIETSNLTTTFTIKGSGLTPETKASFQTLIAQQASIADPNGTNTVTIAADTVNITEVSQGTNENLLLKIDISVPSQHINTIKDQLTMFTNVERLNTALTIQGISRENLFFVNKNIDLKIVEEFGNMGNIFSKLLGKKVKEGNTNMATSSSSGNILFGIKNNDYTKILSRTGRVMNITISVLDINRQKNVLIQGGILKVQPQSKVVTPPTQQANLNSAISSSSGGSVSIGDINMRNSGGGINNNSYPIYIKDKRGNLVPSFNQKHNAYLLPGSDPALLNQNNTPFYGEYSSFESAMNNPSNPLVNPINSMNPIEYSQTLFGPWTTPMMTKTACLNCDDDKEKVNNKTGSTDSIDSIDSLGSTDSNRLNSSNNIFNDINNEANRMMAQNGEIDEDRGSNVRMNTKSGNSNNNYSEYDNGSSNGSNGSNGSQAPCPPCGRCPETSNFECKKVPNYEMGLDNTALPRPVLSNFSTFGS